MKATNQQKSSQCTFWSAFCRERHVSVCVNAFDRNEFNSLFGTAHQRFYWSIYTYKCKLNFSHNYVMASAYQNERHSLTQKGNIFAFFFWVFLLKINGVERNTSAFSNETSTFTLFCLNLVLNLTQTPDSPKKSALFSISFRFFTICTETSQLANKLRNGLTFQRAHHRSCVLFLLHWHRVRLQPAQRLVDVWLLL